MKIIFIKKADGETDIVLNLDQVCALRENTQEPISRTEVLMPGVQIVIGVPFVDVMAMIEKYIKDDFELTHKMQSAHRQAATEELENLLKSVMGKS